LASAIVAAAQERNLKLSEVRDFESQPGKGIVASVDGKRVAVGNLAMLREEGIQRNAFLVGGTAIDTAVFIAVDHEYAGSISVSDPIKQSADSAIRELKQQGLRIVMLTGDNRVIAENVSRQLRIDEFHAEVL